MREMIAALLFAGTTAAAAYEPFPCLELHAGPSFDFRAPAAERERYAQLRAAAPKTSPASKVDDPFAINFGISGSWFEPGTSGQGMFIDVVPSRDLVVVAWFTHAALSSDATPGEQRWFTATGSYRGDSATLDVFLSRGGRFDAPPAPAAAQIGTLTLRFRDCNRGTADYVLRENGVRGSGDPATGPTLAGRIELSRVTPDVTCVALTTAGVRGKYALVGATVLPMDDDRVLPDHTVLVDGERIVAIGPDGSIVSPAGTTVIPAGGRWLMPGLIDLHTHEGPGVDNWPNDIEGNLLMSLANGITSIGNMGDFTGSLAALRGAVRAGNIAGPEIYVGYFARGGADGGNADTFARSAVEARALVQRAKAERYDFIKTYDQLTRPALEAIFDEARTLGLPVLGHGNNAIPLQDLYSLGQRMVVHASIINRPAGLGGIADATEIPAAAAQLLERRIFLGGTLATSEIITNFGLDTIEGRDPLVRVQSQEGVEFMHDLALQSWRQMLQFRADIRAPVDRRPTFAFIRQYTKALHDAGVPLIAGSDSIGIPGMVPGFTLLRELEIYREMGLSGSAVLATATRNTGRLLRELRPAERVGTIEAGARADLVLLDADPRTELRTFRQPRGVMAAGRWYPGEVLSARLEALRDGR
jgi:imidazolonepropionase-like amidohydrolase